MKTTATFDAITEIVYRRNEALRRRDVLAKNLADTGSLQRAEWNGVLGELKAYDFALERLKEAGEYVASAEYLVRQDEEHGNAELRANVQ